MGRNAKRAGFWGWGFFTSIVALAQAPQQWRPRSAPCGARPSIVTVEQPDAQRTRDQLRQLLERYPLALLRGVSSHWTQVC